MNCFVISVQLIQQNKLFSSQIIIIEDWNLIFESQNSRLWNHTEMTLENQSFVISSELMIVLVVAGVDWDFAVAVPPSWERVERIESKLRVFVGDDDSIRRRRSWWQWSSLPELIEMMTVFFDGKDSPPWEIDVSVRGRRSKNEEKEMFFWFCFFCLFY